MTPQTVEEKAKALSKPWEWSILKAAIENAVMGAFSDGYGARQGDGQTIQDAQEKCQRLTLRVYEAIHLQSVRGVGQLKQEAQLSR